MQKSTVLEKNDFECILTDLKCWWLYSGLAGFEKHQTPVLLLMVDFYAFLKLHIFRDF